MSSGLVAFDRLWQRIHQRSGELRPRLAGWLRQLIPTTGPDVPQYVVMAAVTRADGWRCQAHWAMRPRGRRSRSSPYHEFPIAPTVPEGLTEEDVGVLGLPARYLHFVPMAWLQEVMAEAWVEAGLAAQPFPLVVDGSAFRGLGQRWRWTDLLRASAYRVTAPRPESIPAVPEDCMEFVAPPAPLNLPETPAGFREACAAGDAGAVRAWAEALAAAGDAASADLLRWLDGFPDAIRGRVQTWAGHGPFWLHANATQYWWGTGEEGTEPGESDETAARLAQLLAGWNVYHPAAEWLFRRLSLPLVRVRGSYFADGRQGQTFEIDLGAGGHLAPVEGTMGVTGLEARFPRQGGGED